MSKLKSRDIAIMAFNNYCPNNCLGWCKESETVRGIEKCENLLCKDRKLFIEYYDEIVKNINNESKTTKKA